MAHDDVLINKAATIERCVARVREEFERAGTGFATDYTRQDAAILNIQRACEAVLDMAAHVVRRDRLGAPQSARDTLDLLAQNQRLPTELAQRLKNMVGFRNVAVHDYQRLQLPITVNIIKHHLGDFLQFSSLMLQGDGASLNS